MHNYIQARAFVNEVGAVEPRLSILLAQGVYSESCRGEMQEAMVLSDFWHAANLHGGARSVDSCQETGVSDTHTRSRIHTRTWSRRAFKAWHRYGSRKACHPKSARS